MSITLRNVSLLTAVAAMYSIDVDLAQAVSRRRQIDNTEMCYCMPVKSGQELGERTGYIYAKPTELCFPLTMK